MHDFVIKTVKLTYRLLACQNFPGAWPLDPQGKGKDRGMGGKGERKGEGREGIGSHCYSDQSYDSVAMLPSVTRVLFTTNCVTVTYSK